MIAVFIAGLFLGTVCGVVVMALCQAAEKKKLRYGKGEQRMRTASDVFMDEPGSFIKPVKKKDVLSITKRFVKRMIENG